MRNGVLRTSRHRKPKPDNLYIIQTKGEQNMLTVYPTLIEFHDTRTRQRAKSVRMRLSSGDKKAVLNILAELIHFYNKNTFNKNLFHTYQERIGKDSIEYKTEKIFKDIAKKMVDWHKARNDIFESYIMRSNHTVVDTATKIANYKGVGYSTAADAFIDAFYIDYGKGKPPTFTPKTASIREELFV